MRRLSMRSKEELLCICFLVSMYNIYIYIYIFIFIYISIAMCNLCIDPLQWAGLSSVSAILEYNRYGMVNFCAILGCIVR